MLSIESLRAGDMAEKQEAGRRKTKCKRDSKKTRESKTKHNDYKQGNREIRE